MEDKDRGRNQAEAQFNSIKEMMEELKEAENNQIYHHGSEEAVEEARDKIQNDPLSVEVRSDWHTPNSGENKSTEYQILLCWGGPAVRIIGDLDKYSCPETAKIEYQDWFTSWTEYPLDDEEEKIVLEYAECFYYDE